MGAERQDHRRRPAFFLLQAAHAGGAFEAVHVGHVQVHEHQPVAAFTGGERFQGLAAVVAEHRAGHAEALQVAARDHLVDRVVLRHQHAQAALGVHRFPFRQQRHLARAAVADQLLQFGHREHRAAHQGDVVAHYHFAAFAHAAQQHRPQPGVAFAGRPQPLVQQHSVADAVDQQMAAVVLAQRPLHRRQIVHHPHPGEARVALQQLAQVAHRVPHQRRHRGPFRHRHRLLQHRQRNHETERGALLRRAAHFDLSAHQAHKLLADRQPQAGAAEALRHRGGRLAEVLEQPALLLAGHADAAVADGELDHRPAIALLQAAGAHPDPAVAGELDRVGEQVGEHLAQPGRIAAQLRRQVGVRVHQHQVAVVAGRQAEHVRAIDQQGGGVERRLLQLQLAGFQLGVIEHVVDQRVQRAAGVLDQPDVLLLARRRIGFAQQLRQPQHAVQRRAYLMAHARQELALGAHLGAAANGAAGEVEEHQAEHQHQQIQQQQAGRDQPAVAQALAAPLLHQHHRDAGDVLAEITQALLALAALGQRLLPGDGHPRRQQQRLPRPLQVTLQFRAGAPPLLAQPRLAGARGERLDLALHLGDPLFQPGQGALQLAQVHRAQIAAVEAGVDGDGADDAQVVAELAQPVQRQGQGLVGAGAGLGDRELQQQ